jgi:hypothetical protein
MKKTTVRRTTTSTEARSSRPARRASVANGTAHQLTPAERKRAARDMSLSETIARKLRRAAGEEDPAHVAGAIVLFATDTIKRSAANLPEARSYLDGMRIAIDGMLKNAFPEKGAMRRRSGDYSVFCWCPHSLQAKAPRVSPASSWTRFFAPHLPHVASTRVLPFVTETAFFSIASRISRSASSRCACFDMSSPVEAASLAPGTPQGQHPRDGVRRPMTPHHG